jgi:hypothetical protein
MSNLDKVYQYLANHMPDRLIWFCIFRAWALHQHVTNSYKLPSQVFVVELIHRLDTKND